MPAIAFAKWAFHTAIALGAGDGHAWPLMQAMVLAPPAVYEQLEVDGAVVQPSTCSAFMSTCTTPWDGAPGRWAQRFCVAGPGAYTVTLTAAIGTAAGETPVHGRVWLTRVTRGWGERTETALLAAFRALPGEISQAYGAVTVAAPAGACYALSYDADGQVSVDPDQRVSFLTIHRAGA